MFPKKSPLTPWAQMIEILQTGATNESARAWRDELVRRKNSLPVKNSATAIPSMTHARVVGRLSPVTAAVEWADSTSARYGDQIWRSGTAKETGNCAVTCFRIDVGDPVYRPVSRPWNPLNRDAMILAYIVQTSCGERFDESL